jgi:GNAT superfamily N-acetyltransferase
MNRLIHLLRRLVYEKRRYVFFGYDPKQGEGRADPHVRVYERWEDIPRPFRKIAVASPWTNAMFYRMKRRQARLLCCSDDGQTLQAYGWVQDWRPFRRRFGAIAAEGTMLGFYRTAPSERGRGLYGRLLAHSLLLCRKDKPILIATSPDNPASLRGIEKAGFSPLGVWEARVFFRGISRMRRVSGPGGEGAA